MSTQLFRKYRTRLYLSLSALTVALLGFSSAASQQLSVTLRVFPDSSRVAVKGVCPPMRVWSFPDSYAGVLGLGNRIAQLRLFDEAGNEILSRKIAPGQFDAEKPASRFHYEVSIEPPARPAAAAMVSWLTRERGLLKLADLLPQFAFSDAKQPPGVSATVKLELPENWRFFGSEKEKSASLFEAADVSKVTVALGPRLRLSELTESGMTFRMISDGEWAFADREALEMVGKILKADRKVFGDMPAKQAALMLFPFPRAVGASQWSGETRGATVTLLMGKHPSKVGALAQLSTPLMHEFFHLWVPNGLALSGDYDWFYEGFTNYQAAQMAVRLDMLTFPEFLNAIGRAYDGYLADKDRDRWSLVEASRRRWTSGGSSVYSKSMVVAFLFDLKLRSKGGGKPSLDDVYSKLFAQNRLAATGLRPVGPIGVAEGSEVALNLLAGVTSIDFVRAIIREPFTVDLQKDLAPYGLVVERIGLRSRLAVSERLNKNQRDLLRELGYNDEVRSAHPDTKHRGIKQ